MNVSSSVVVALFTVVATAITLSKADYVDNLFQPTTEKQRHVAFGDNDDPPDIHNAFSILEGVEVINDLLCHKQRRAILKHYIRNFVKRNAVGYVKQLEVWELCDHFTTYFSDEPSSHDEFKFILSFITSNKKKQTCYKWLQVSDEVCKVMHIDNMHFMGKVLYLKGTMARNLNMNVFKQLLKHYKVPISESLITRATDEEEEDKINY